MTPSIGIVGAGLVGRAAIDALAAAGHDEMLVSESHGDTPVSLPPTVDVGDRRHTLDRPVVLLTGPAPHVDLARWALARGRHCVSVSDDAADVGRLLALESVAVDRGATLVVGAGMMPGLSGLLARYLADGLDVVDEVHCFAHGTGGPSCARQHHRALAGTSVSWHDGSWVERPAGSGRELCWFPDPVGPRDCYRVESPEPTLLVRAIPELRRASARYSATRRDRLTARLPMLSPPHAAGGVGAIRVEVRGAIGRERVTQVVGAAGRAAKLAGIVAATYADLLAIGRFERRGVVVPGEATDVSREVLDRVRDAGVALGEFVGPSS